MSEAKTSEFVRLLSTNQLRIYGYIVSMVGNTNDADDIMQETTVTMWQKFSEFHSGTDFLAWGISIAYYKVLEFRSRKNKPLMGEDLLQQLHDKAPEKLADINLYIDLLNQCIEKLDTKDSQLLKLRYMSGYSVNEISKRFNRTIQAVYRRLSILHGFLTRCIKRSIRTEEEYA